jgi:hypothetical protein
MLKLRVAGGLVLLAIAAPVGAQVTVGTDVALNSRYMFWGLTLSNRPVVQPDVWVAVAGFTGGVWGNVELSKDSKASDLTSGGTRSGITEVDYWLEYGRSLATADVKLGVIRWTYPSSNTGTLGPCVPDCGIPNNGPDVNSTELYGAVTLSKLPLSPNVTAYYDVDLYKGLFGWASLSHSIPVATKSVNLSALMGFCASMSNTGASQLPLYTKHGITHFDFAAAVPLTIGSVSVNPNGHFQVNVVDDTKSTSATQSNGKTVFTFGVTLSWSRGLGASTSTE